tara:strand:- start:38744 stop:39700 length:957 start_codon:yes stop_codon:yes gene_type:complete
VSESWIAKAPSNIALIKYMGKTNSKVNLPTNGSLSLTLGHLLTTVKISELQGSEDQWSALTGEGIQAVELSEKGKRRFLDHFSFLKKEFGIEGTYLIESGNNFPSDCGLASSASSFAALTLASYELAKSKASADYMLSELANLSRKGSGSSCRSLFSPWCQWREDSVEAIEALPNNLLHSVVVVHNGRKKVSSSEAHLRVLTSAVFEGRVERAEKRLSDLKQSLRTKNWKESFEICWAEFWDMHGLFETSAPPFGYMTPQSLQVLNQVREQWEEFNDGPIVTMDAGANVHLIYRADQLELAKDLNQKFSQEYSTYNSF